MTAIDKTGARSGTPAGIIPIGVSSTIRNGQISHLKDPEQDEVIKAEFRRLEGELREFVGGALPRGDLVAQVQGPHDDALQGRIWIHTVMGMFAVDDLPAGCAAYKVHVTGEPYVPTQDPTTDGSGA